MGDLTGLVTGMRREAALLRGMPLVACAGAEPEVAARALLAAGATRLLSFGLAGGLDPKLRPGTLVLATAILDDGRATATDSAWAESLALPGVVRAPVLGEAKPLATPAAKAAAFAASGAAVVDTESGAVARVAAAAGVPVLALRAIADPAGQRVPAAALCIIDGQGRVRLRTALGALLLHPVAMLELAAQARAGMRALRQAAAGL